MIICGNIPPLQPLWDRFVTHKLGSGYGRTPIDHYKLSENGDSRGGINGSGFKKSTIPSTTATATSQTIVWGGNQSSRGINTTTDVRVSESAAELL
jgi:hypothetical protein